MSDYTKTVDFAAKDALSPGNPAKAGKGTEVDTEFVNIQVAVATKEDKSAKGSASGYAGLDSSSRIASSALPLDISAQNIQAATNYTLVITDANKHIYHTSGSSHTYTIPANVSVAYPVGTVLSFVNVGAGVLVIAITSDNMVLAGTATTGSRNLGTNGIAQALKVSSNLWLISGAGLS